VRLFVVIIDKPFARSTKEADAVIELAKEKDRVLTCFQNRRYVSYSLRYFIVVLEVAASLQSQNMALAILEFQISTAIESFHTSLN
jgi:hypothetical protein